MARRFIGGPSDEAAVAAAVGLRDDLGITASLFYLGEYVSDPAQVETNVHSAVAVTELLDEADLDVHVSVDPTAIGYLISEGAGQRNAEQIARAIAGRRPRPRNYLMLDMEDLAQLEPTLRLHAHLRRQGLPAGITLQARLRRTAEDLRGLGDMPTAVRLVKGAFPMGPDHEHSGASAIAASYLALGETMLSTAAKDNGFYPVFATHDDLLAEQIIDTARRTGLRPDQYEFELLYGVRPDWQEALRARGIQVRVYMPFGHDWWPYAIRRVGENPKNALLMGRAAFSRTGYRRSA